MELNITKFFNEAAPMDYSASIAEIGANAGPDTWRAACEDSGEYPLLDSEEKREAAKAFFLGFGAWDSEELDNIDLNALLIQFIAGDMREFQELADGDWQEWDELCQGGTCSSRLFKGKDGEYYFDISE